MFSALNVLLSTIRYPRSKWVRMALFYHVAGSGNARIGFGVENPVEIGGGIETNGG